MKVGLINVDSKKFPNLALMKISAHHKAKGDQVEWWNGLCQYDVVYKSKVFDATYSRDEEHCIMADKIITGGTGYDIKSILSREIEHTPPDYSIFGITNKAYGFLTRGCPRGCEFCIVSGKEGRIAHQTTELREFWTGQKEIVLIDSNITASKECVKLFKELAQTRAWIDFTGGLDVRFMDNEKTALLNEMRIRMIHFAWDNYEFETYEKLKEARAVLRHRPRDLGVYVLTNFNTTHEQDLERIYKLVELGYAPYVMVFDRPKATRQVRLVQRWVNNRYIFNTVKRFEDYDPSIG